MAISLMNFVTTCLLALVLSLGQAAPVPEVLPRGLPDVLVMSDGTRVTTPAQWQARRSELLKLFTVQEYGVAPPVPRRMRFVVAGRTLNALSGRAMRKQITILLDGTVNGPALHLLLYIPKHVRRPPVILGMNFWGNETVNADPGIFLSADWMDSQKIPYVDLSCVRNNRATDACRAINASQWPIETMLARGYALATLSRLDVDPDTKDGYAMSLRAHYPDLQNRPDNFSTIGAWAWAMSRAMDYLQTDRDVDATRVALFGWSRLGKAALWAGATDQRFAMIFSNESGAGGAKLFRRNIGETVLQLNTKFPYFYCENFKRYNGEDATLPFDQHMVIAMIAPRPVYIASAIDNPGADPEGEFLGGLAADPVYRLLGTDGLPVTQWPPVNHPVMGQIGYHVRTGGHDVTAYDWAQYLDFADMQFKPAGGSKTQ